MITCTPQSLFSWEYELEGDAHRGRISMDWMREKGEVEADGVTYDVVKHGMTSGQWSLERHGQAEMTAHKTSFFKRAFEVKGRHGTFILRARNFYGRVFLIETAHQPLGTIKPINFYSRKATIEMKHPDVAFPAVIFMFFLAVVTWRRARRRD